MAERWGKWAAILIVAIGLLYVAVGLLCVAGTLGPATGTMGLQLIATAGYAFLMPLTCIPLAMLFGRSGTA